MIREQIANGVYYTFIEGNYKKNRISVILRKPLAREDITETALLPYILERGTASCPDIIMLRRKLDMLYGSSLYTSVSSFDFSRTLSVSIEGVEERYVGEEVNLLGQRAEFLIDVLCNPMVENGQFKKEYIYIEREKLREVIYSEINEKRSYCLNLASETFFENDERSNPNHGYIEDLDKITGSSLYETYKSFLNTSTIEIFVVGKSEKNVKEIFAKAFCGAPRSPKEIKGFCSIDHVESPKRVVKQFDIEQDKLAMIYSAGRLLNHDEQVALKVASAAYGGVPTSRLFVNVREKQSLCYYCASRPGIYTGALTVDSGVEHENVQKAIDAINLELEQVIKEQITDKELHEVKLMLQNSMRMIGNTPESVIGWYFSCLTRFGLFIKPEQEIQKILGVTKKQVSDILSLMKLNVICLLERKES